MDITFSDSGLPALDTEMLGIVIEDPTAIPAAATSIDDALGGHLARELERGRLRIGKPDASVVTGGEHGPARIALIGVAKPGSSGRTEVLRNTGGRFAAMSKSHRVAAPSLLVTGLSDADATALVEGFMLAAYRFDRYKSRRRDDQESQSDPVAPSSLKVVGATGAAQAAIERAAMIVQATNWARELANCPANDMTPAHLAEEARKLGELHEHMTIRVLDRAEIIAAGMGLIAAVGQSSPNEPRVIVLEWNPRGVDTADGDRIAIIGKGITFDTGGISLKPPPGMAEMRLDKSAGCAVIATMRVAAEMDIQQRILAVVASSENMPGANAFKPGDVITAMDGTTVEVTNTDAEGRLVLADAICYARSLGCGRIIEMSTLTGHMVVSLGHYFAGLITDDDDLASSILESAKRTGDHAWHMPMHDAYKRELHSDCADLQNSGGRPAGGLYAGLFLKHFARDTPFAHIDIAGSGFISKARDYYSVKGATGWGVRLLVDYLDQ